jgi:hypothetical protein
MAWLPFFVDEQDTVLLRDRLNADPEIAFLVSAGLVHPERSDVGTAVSGGYRQRWKAESKVDTLADGRHVLWHVPGGPLPLRPDTSQGVTLGALRNQRAIPDPWSGWVEEQAGANSTGPSFCAASSVIDLTLRSRVSPYTAAERTSLPRLVSYWTAGEDMLVASDFAFGGDLSPATPQTLRWWSRTKRWIGTVAVRLQSPGRQPTNFWAFPSAFRRLKAGTRYSANNFNLDASIQAAAARPDLS